MYTKIGVAIKKKHFYEFLVVECCISLNMHFLQSLLKILISIIEGPKYLFSYIWSKMLSSSLYTMLKLSKTTSPNKLFDYDCLTLYICKIQNVIQPWNAEKW